MSNFSDLFSPVSQMLMFFLLFPFLINRIGIEKEKTIFIYFIAFSTVMEIYTDTSLIFKLTYIWMSHIYFPAEYFFFFFTLLGWESHYKKPWLILGVMVGIFVLIDNFVITSFFTYSTKSLSIQNLFLFLFSSWTIIGISTKNFIPFYKDERFYIAAGIFIYSGLTSLMYLFYNAFNILFPFYIVSWSAICLNLFFTYSMVLYYRQRKMLTEALK